MNRILSIIIIFFFALFFIVSCYVLKDFGIGIEETFHRASGLYWLKYLINNTSFNEFKTLIDLKLENLYKLNPNLPNVEDFKYYGIIFDLPATILELFFNFDNNIYNIYLKHFLSFLIFFISGICFALIIKKRFPNNYVVLFSSVAYLLTPKIYGASFFDGKDLFFLSIFTITMFFYVKYEKNNSFKNLIFLAIFCGFSISSRPFGLIIPSTFLIIQLLNIVCNFKKKFFYIIIFFLLIIFLTLELSWPYLWSFDFNSNLWTSIPPKMKVFFNGEFYNNEFLPISYIPKLIFISTPIYILLFFLIGLFFIFKRFYLRFIIIENTKKIYADFWRGRNEKIDFFFLIVFLQIITTNILFSTTLYSSWRYFYFFHYILIYFFAYAIFIIFTLIRKNKKKIIFFSLLLLFFNIEMLYKNYLYHPYQNSYFNNFLNKNDKLKFERDTAHLSRAHSLREILLDSKEKSTVNIGTASWSPLQDIKYILSEEEKQKINLIGNDELENSDYIFTNYIYEVNLKYNDKYKIPNNFNLYKSVIKDDNLIYSIYKKK